MAKFRKKPIVVEAFRFCGPELSVTIETLEGNLRADYGDWIVTGVNGEQYPVKDDIFHKTYDEVKDMTKTTRWLSTKWATVRVDTEDGIIVQTAPIFKRFEGQPFMNLVNWLTSKGDIVTIKTLEQKDE